MSKTNTFFIAGVQRSGTTLLSVLLGKHPAIDIDGFAVAFRLITCLKNYEKVIPNNLQHRDNEVLKWKIETDYKGRLAEFLDYENLEKYSDIKALIAASIEQRLAKSGKQIWGDKAPNLQHYLADISMLIPQAKIIHIVRDGRAVAYSHAARAHQHILLAAHDWVMGNTVAFANQQLVGKDRYLIVKYEDLLEFPERIARETCAFLGLEFTNTMLDIATENDAESYVKSTFDRSKIEQYKTQIPAKTLRKIERIQAPLLQKLGYDLVHKNTLQDAKLLPLWKQIYFRQHANIRMLFRSKRMAMIDRKNVEIPISWRNRWSKFVLTLGHDFLPKEVYKKMIGRVHDKNQRL